MSPHELCRGKQSVPFPPPQVEELQRLPGGTQQRRTLPRPESSSCRQKASKRGDADPRVHVYVCAGVQMCLHLRVSVRAEIRASVRARRAAPVSARRCVCALTCAGDYTYVCVRAPAHALHTRVLQKAVLGSTGQHFMRNSHPLSARCCTWGRGNMRGVPWSCSPHPCCTARAQHTGKSPPPSPHLLRFLLLPFPLLPPAPPPCCPAGPPSILPA